VAAYRQFSREELTNEHTALQQEFINWKTKELHLNMARGKPGSDQLALSMAMLDVLNSTSDCHAESGFDCRNYGELAGIPEARELFGAYMGVSTDEIIMTGPRSTPFIYDCIARAMLKGVLGSEKPWCKYDEIKFICPVPGYDRHFAMCEFLGIKMIPVSLNEWGPDIGRIEQLIAEDETIKGIWCVPKYSNPLGIVYSDETVRRLAGLKPAAKDFRIFWDNAYAMHAVYRDIPLLNILEECKQAGSPNMVYMFGSTSKMVFPGSGVSFFGASAENIRFTLEQVNIETSSWDNLNTLRHVRYLRDVGGIRSLMEKHAAILRGKFDIVLNTFERELGGRAVGGWVKPDGGYFITYMAEPGCAKRIVAICKEAGVVLTDAGATHPYGNDPKDSYIRIAPSLPERDELVAAMEIFCVAARLVAVEKLLKPV